MVTSFCLSSGVYIGIYHIPHPVSRISFPPPKEIIFFEYWLYYHLLRSTCSSPFSHFSSLFPRACRRFIFGGRQNGGQSLPQYATPARMAEVAQGWGIFILIYLLNAISDRFSTLFVAFQAIYVLTIGKNF